MRRHPCRTVVWSLPPKASPISGRLSGFNIEIGQSIERGGRLGQIDDPDGFKLNVRIDEYYLGRVDLQQVAVAEHSGGDYELQVSKIYPQVNDGQFEVDMAFDAEPEGLRRGQTLQLRLTLGDNSDAILIPNGSFYQETGGSWIFVVSPDGTEAVKRNVRLGRRNTDFIEVLDGLEPVAPPAGRGSPGTYVSLESATRGRGDSVRPESRRHVHRLARRLPL